MLHVTKGEDPPSGVQELSCGAAAAGPTVQQIAAAQARNPQRVECILCPAKYHQFPSNHCASLEQMGVQGLSRFWPKEHPEVVKFSDGFRALRGEYGAQKGAARPPAASTIASALPSASMISSPMRGLAVRRTAAVQLSPSTRIRRASLTPTSIR